MDVKFPKSGWKVNAWILEEERSLMRDHVNLPSLHRPWTNL